jgi:predicted type IV restriction endonuclease
MNTSAKNAPAPLIDYITGQSIPDVGAEANRQAVERFLVASRGYAKTEIAVELPIEIEIDGENYRSAADLAVIIDGKYLMVIKCAAGSLGSREREVLSAARLLVDYQIPLAVVSDGRTALVFDTLTRKKRGEGMNAIPSRSELVDMARDFTFAPLAPEQRKREKLIFRTYDSMNVNVNRPK